MGAKRYVVKDAAPSELAEAIRTAYEAAVFAPGRCGTLALRSWTAPTASRSLSDQHGSGPGAGLVASHPSEIAEALGISAKTVDAHRLNLLSKLKLRNNAELASFAARHGLITVKMTNVSLSAGCPESRRLSPSRQEGLGRFRFP
jgi:DNA-binding NarL/FixJ family response regulator